MKSLSDIIIEKSTTTTITGIGGVGIVKGSESFQTEFFQQVWLFGQTGVEISWALGFVLIGLSVIAKVLEITLHSLKVKKEMGD